MPFEIISERPDTEVAQALIAELEATLNPRYPPESRYGYSVEKLLREGVEFFVVRCDGVPAGCCGIQFFGEEPSEYGEVKRMFVRPEFRGAGLGKFMLGHLCGHAHARGVRVLRLETGVHQLEAIGLYERVGFVRIGPFGTYWDNPLSRFFEKHIG